MNRFKLARESFRYDMETHNNIKGWGTVRISKTDMEKISDRLACCYDENAHILNESTRKARKGRQLVKTNNLQSS
jgi:hypothetical protein